MTGDAATCARALVDQTEKGDNEAIEVLVIVENAFQLAIRAPLKEGVIPKTPVEVADYKAHSRASFLAQEDQRKRTSSVSGVLPSPVAVSTPTLGRRSGSMVSKSNQDRTSGQSGPLVASSEEPPGSPSVRRISLLKRRGTVGGDSRLAEGPLRQGTMFMWVESADKWKVRLVFLFFFFFWFFF
jgi:hypothetical protein